MKRSVSSRLAAVERTLAKDLPSDLFHLILGQPGESNEQAVERCPPANDQAFVLLINLQPPAGGQSKQVSEDAELALVRKQLKERGYTDEQIKQIEGT